MRMKSHLIGNIKVKLTQLLNSHKGKNIFITQGYICRNSKGEVDNLKRGGSDYSASLIAAAINATSLRDLDRYRWYAQQ